MSILSGRAKGISLSYVYTITSTIIGVFISAFTIRMLGKTEYGVYQTMTSFLSYLTLFEFGTGTIMTRNLSLCEKDRDDLEVKKNYSTVLLIAFILSLVIAFVSVLFYLSIDRIYVNTLSITQREHGKLLFALMAVRAIVAFLIQTMNGAILAFEHYSFSQIVKIAYLLLRTSFVIVLLLARPTSLIIVVIDTTLTLAELFVTMYYCTRRIGLHFSLDDIDVSIYKLSIPLAFAMFLQTVVNMANGNVDKFVIGVVLSPEAVAIYSVALFIYSSFSGMTTIPIAMYLPQIASNMKSGLSGNELTSTLVKPCRLIAMIGGVILFGFFAVGKQFIALIYGSDYMEAWLIALVIMTPMYVNMSNGILINILDVMRKRHVRSLILLVTTVLNIWLTIWWIKTWGMLGAAIATAVSTILGQIFLMNIYYYKIIKVNIISLFSETYKGILLSLVLSCTGACLVVRIIGNTICAFCFGGLLFCLAFFFLMYFIGASPSEKEMFDMLIQRIRKQ